MPNAQPPPEILGLLEERRVARAAGDWPRADALRDRLAQLGWQVQDGPTGSSLRPMLPRGTRDMPRDDDTALPSLLEEAAGVAASVQIVAEDHPGDLARFLAGFAAHAAEMQVELLIVANAPTFELDAVVAGVGLPLDPVVLRVAHRLGWAESRTLGLTRSRGAITVLVDTSLEPVGDFMSPLLAALDDPRTGIAGPWGLMSDDGRHFEDAPPGEVDAVAGYCLAIRRDALQSVGGFDPRFRFYRNADLDLCFAVRNAGWRVVATNPVPLAVHAHRGEEGLPEEERDRLSRRNFYRFLKHWGDRRDLLVGSGQAQRR